VAVQRTFNKLKNCLFFLPDAGNLHKISTQPAFWLALMGETNGWADDR
jgi:hypothetical protein